MASEKKWFAPQLVEIPFLMTEKCRNGGESTFTIGTGTFLHCDQDGQTSVNIPSGSVGSNGPS